MKNALVYLVEGDDMMRLVNALQEDNCEVAYAADSIEEALAQFRALKQKNESLDFVFVQIEEGDEMLVERFAKIADRTVIVPIAPEQDSDLLNACSKCGVTRFLPLDFEELHVEKILFGKIESSKPLPYSVRAKKEAWEYTVEEKAKAFDEAHAMAVSYISEYVQGYGDDDEDFEFGASLKDFAIELAYPRQYGERPFSELTKEREEALNGE